jgi:hypothetical protein
MGLRNEPELVTASFGCRPAPVLAIVLLVALAPPLRADDQADKARPLVEASHAEIRAIYLGRWMSRTRWNEILDEALYTFAPKGRWGPDHPAWPAARAALADAVRAASVADLRGETGTMVREVVDEHYSSLDPAEAAQAVAFYESPGGRAFRDSREKILAEKTYGLPFVVETESSDAYEHAMDDARQRLLNLPDDQTERVYDFNQSKVGEFLLALENDTIADIIGNIMRSALQSIVEQHADELARTVRAAVPTMPPPSDKVYLGTATMNQDRAIDLVIEYHEGYRTAGTYRLSYAPGDRHWHDVVDGLPDLARGETRFLYRDPRGRLSDAP